MPGLGLYVTLKDVKGVKSITVVDTKVVPMTQGGKIGTSGVMGPYVPRKNPSRSEDCVMTTYIGKP